MHVFHVSDKCYIFCEIINVFVINDNRCPWSRIACKGWKGTFVCVRRKVYAREGR